MSNPRIKKEIKKNGHLIAGSASFLGLGIAAISSVALSPIAALMLGGMMIPVALDVIGLKMLISKPKSLFHNISFLDKPFKKQIGKWIKNYIADSDNVTEKKYKVACLSIWMNHEGYPLNSIVSEAVFKDLSDELVRNNEISKFFPLQYMFGDSQDAIESIYGIKPSIKTFLETDKSYPEKIEIAKKVYKEYSQLGMAANAFLKRENFEELLVLQDYRFNSEDYNVIEQYLDKFKENNMQHHVKFMTVKLYSDETKRDLKKIIQEEDNPKNLEILRRYCSEILDKSTLEHYADDIQKKIDYIQLGEELETKPINNQQANKRLKI